MSEPPFVPKPGQVDYTNIRYAPALDVVVTYGGNILLVKRSAHMRLYPDRWATVDGFLDDDKSIEEKAYEELSEEINLRRDQIVSIKRGQVILKEDLEYHKTWFIVPVLATVSTDTFTLDWEASEARWFKPADIKGLDLLPSTDKVVGQFFPEVLQST